MPGEHIQALPFGTILDVYRIESVLGHGGFGITYLAKDTETGESVAIKEYLPPDIAARDTDSFIYPKTQDNQSDFDWGLERFFDEANVLARFNHPNLIAVQRFFRACGTGYIVMDFADGETLHDLLKRTKRLTEEQLLGVLLPIIDGLQLVHRAQFLHRDIKPGNIIIQRDGQPVLLDFGSARQAVGALSRSVTSIVTPGYAPIEQYSARGNQGPWTDIYALAALAYRCLTGEPPRDATDRVREDPLIPISQAAAGQASPSLLKSIDWALSFEEEKRPQLLSQWLVDLPSSSSQPINPVDYVEPKSDTVDQDVAAKSQEKPSSKKYQSKVVSMPRRSQRPRTELPPIEVVSSTPLSNEEKSQRRTAIKLIAGAACLLLILVGYAANEIGGSFSQEQADTEAWNQAVQRNTQVAFRQYTQENPTGRFVSQAFLEIDRLAERQAWFDARAADEVAAYSIYLTRFPRGENTGDARGRIEQLRLEETARTGAIAEVQSSLQVLGYEIGTVDGQLGAATQAAIEDFRQKAGLSLFSEIDAALFEALQDALDHHELVSNIQKELQRLGYNVGSSDGQLGQRSIAAVRDFASTAGLSIGTEPTVALLTILRGTNQRPVRDLVSGDEFVDCDVCPRMKILPPGSFKMGDLEEEGDDDELPVRTVEIEEAFAVSAYEVTNAEWQACVAGGGCIPLPREGWVPPTQPATPVTWQSAKTYVAWLSRKTGEAYRLLTESEWEYAARAGTDTRYAFGDSTNDICEYANVADRSNRAVTDTDVAECGDGFVAVSPVGQFKANDFGLHDVHGNVWEWVEDCWSETYERAPRDGEAFASFSCEQRVLRGGSWQNRPALVRVANRLSQDPAAINDRFGFRIARDM